MTADEPPRPEPANVLVRVKDRVALYHFGRLALVMDGAVESVEADEAALTDRGTFPPDLADIRPGA